MSQEYLIALGILAVLYAGVIIRQVVGWGPQLSSMFLAGGGAMVLVGILTPAQALASVSFPTLAFLFSMFVLVAAIDNAGVIEHVALWVVSRGRSAERIPFYLFLGFGLLSAVLMNDALVLVGVPLVLSLARRLKVSPVPLLLTIAYAVTVGSVMTPMGNPQNALIAFDSGLRYPITTFLEYLLLPTVVNLVVGAWLMERWLGRPMADAKVPAPERVRLFPSIGWSEWSTRVRNYPSIVVFPATIGALFIGDVGAALNLLPQDPIWAVSLAGAILLLLVQPSKRNLVDRVDWNTLLLFVGLFVVMGGVLHAGLFGSMGSFLRIPPASGHDASAATLGGIIGGGVLGSQVLSNVPWTAIFIPLLQGLGYGPGSPRAWVALAAGTTLAGNLTLLGAASNLIVVTQAERAGVRIRLGEFMRYGVPLTLVTVAVVFAFLVVLP